MAFLRRLTIAVFLAFVIYTVPSSAKVKWQPNMKTFSHAIKAAYCLQDTEIEVFWYDTGPAALTEQWFTGSDCFNPNTIVRYYIDGDTSPTIEMNLYVGHGIGFVSSTNMNNQSKMEVDAMENFNMKERFEDNGEDSTVPWGTKRIGHLAKGGGLYNTFRIPFAKSIRITFVSTKGQGYYWFIVRGSENYPIVIGDIELPKTAKLKLHKIEEMTIYPLQYIQLASAKNKSGMLFQVTLAASSVDFHYLEACFRAVIDDQNDIQYLSSGTEDFFLSGFYYNAGQYHTNDAGLTYKRDPGTMSAYKFFEEDPVLFTKSFKLFWRCGEQFTDNRCFKLSNRACYAKGGETYCKNRNGVHERLGNLDPSITKMTTYVWVYEWPSQN